MTLFLGLLAACSTAPTRDDANCWADDRQIWTTYWDDWCDALDACGTIETYGPYQDVASCRADARANTGTYVASCLNGCATDVCLEAVAHYASTCDVGEIPIGDCDMMLQGTNPYGSCSE